MGRVVGAGDEGALSGSLERGEVLLERAEGATGGGSGLVDPRVVLGGGDQSVNLGLIASELLLQEPRGRLGILSLVQPRREERDERAKEILVDPRVDEAVQRLAAREQRALGRAILLVKLPSAKSHAALTYSAMVHESVIQPSSVWRVGTETFGLPVSFSNSPRIWANVLPLSSYGTPSVLRSTSVFHAYGPTLMSWPSSRERP